MFFSHREKEEEDKMEVIIVCFVSSPGATAGDSLLAKGIQCSNCVFTQEAEDWSLKKKKKSITCYLQYS